MSSRLGVRALILAALVLPASAAGESPTAEKRLEATRVLVQRLVGSGRCEASVMLVVEDPMGGPPRVQRGTLALEPPSRVRLDFANGERIAVRGDGGEWLQPAQRQMIRLGSGQAGLVSWLWDLFLKGGQGRFHERAAGARRFVLTAGDDARGLPDTIGIVVDARGLPAALEIRDAGLGETLYRFSGWRFAKPRGATAFELRAPAGFTVHEEADSMDPVRR